MTIKDILTMKDENFFSRKAFFDSSFFESWEFSENKKKELSTWNFPLWKTFPRSEESFMSFIGQFSKLVATFLWFHCVVLRYDITSTAFHPIVYKFSVPSLIHTVFTHFCSRRTENDYWQNFGASGLITVKLQKQGNEIFTTFSLSKKALNAGACP